MRKLLIALPAFVLGGLLTASLTTVAGAKDPAPTKSYDYAVAEAPGNLRKYGKAGYVIVNVLRNSSANGGYPYWTMQRK